MTVRTALLQGAQILEQASIEAPRLTAEILLMHAVNLSTKADRAWLYAHSDDELKQLWWIHYGRYLDERLKGKPTQYITGHQEFYGRDFLVTPDVLIPRPETEHLVEAALAIANAASEAALAIETLKSPAAASEAALAVANTSPRSILDIGTGSGAIAITLALELKQRVVGTDISIAAIKVARKNAIRLGSDIQFVQCDLGCALTGPFDLIVANPPYVPETSRESLQKEVRDFEPSLALFAGNDGLDIYRRLIPEASWLLAPEGWLMMEIGSGQAAAIQKMLGGWRNVNLLPDLAGLPRVAIAKRP